MQFVNQRMPIVPGGAATAFGAAGEAINNLLGIYAGYKNKQLEEKRRAEEMAMRQQQLDLHKREAERQDVMDQLRIRQEQISEAEKGLPGTRPDVQGTMQVRTRTGGDLSSAPGEIQPETPADTTAPGADANKPGAIQTGVPPPKPAESTQTWQTIAPAPVQYARIKAVTDSRGNVVAPELQYQVKYQPEVQAEQNKALQERGIAEGKLHRMTDQDRAVINSLSDEYPGLKLFANADVMDDTTYKAMASMAKTKQKQYGSPIVDPVTGEIRQQDASTGQWVVTGRTHVKPERESTSDRKARKDEEQNAMIESITPGNPETIPVQYRDYVVAASEGRTIQPRAGTNMNLVEQMAFRYNPDLDRGTIKARQDLIKDVTKGSVTQRGGQISSLDVLSEHLTKLQKATDKLSASGLGSLPVDFLNASIQKVVPGGFQKAVTNYADTAKAAKTEFIRALKGASPTDSENREFKALEDPALSPAERQQHIETLRELIESRANSHEAVWNGAFKKSSVESGHPLMHGHWVWDGYQWRLPNTDEIRAGKVGRNATKAKTGDPAGILSSQEKILGAPQNSLGL